MLNQEDEHKSIENKLKSDQRQEDIESSEVLTDDGKNEIDANSKEKTVKKEEMALRNILVIDDSDALRRVLIKYLQIKFYCNLLEAENGKEGLRIVSSNKKKIDLILCDFMMPVMDGFSFMKMLKENTEYNKIPIIFLTSKNDKDTVTKCISQGASDFIVKPYELNSVSKKISKYITPRSNLTI